MTWSVAPYFIVDDVVVTANFYRDKLGFHYERFWGDPPRFCMVQRSRLGHYFCLGAVSKAYSAVDLHARRRLRRGLCDKYSEPRPGYKRFPEASLQSVYGLVQLPHRTASLSWARA